MAQPDYNKILKLHGKLPEGLSERFIPKENVKKIIKERDDLKKENIELKKKVEELEKAKQLKKPNASKKN